jgi:hypothetical protein
MVGLKNGGLRAWRSGSGLSGSFARILPLWLPLLGVLVSGAEGSIEPSLGPLASLFRWIVPLTMTLAVWVLTAISPGVGFPLFVAMVPFIGLIRREMIPLAGYAGNDPITLFTALVVGGVLVRLLVSRRIQLNTLPAKLLLPLLVVMAFQVFNPAQGGLVVGIAGALFYFVPILFFYIGRSMVDERTLGRMFSVILVSGILCALYGLYQHFFGFNDREWAWVEATRYRQQMFGVYRVFSTFLSFGEYVVFAGMALMVAWTRLLRRQWIYLPLFLLLGFAIFLSSSRSVVICALVACVVTWSVLSRNRRGWIQRGIVAGLVAVLGLVYSLSTVGDAPAVVDRNSVLIGHQASGLTDPLGEESTGRQHLGLVLFGLRSGIVRPAGVGLGATTVAAEKFGTVKDVHTEVDITNFIVSTGTIGGGLYFAMVVVLFRRLLGYWVRTRSVVALSALGLATVAIGNWTTGGYYAPSSIMWLVLGGIDVCLWRLEERERLTVAQSRISVATADPAGLAPAV